MAIFSEDNSKQSSVEVLNIKRAPVPDSAALQQQILRVTEQLPQYVGEQDLAEVYHGEKRFTAVKESIRSRLTFLPAAGALAAGTAVVILSVALWAPLAPSRVDETALLGTTPPVMDELLLQELILMSDEMAFATL